jgi:hypothetical protein
MGDVVLVPSTGVSVTTTMAVDVVGGAIFQPVKINLGTSGADGGLVDVTNPLPVTGVLGITVTVTTTNPVSGTVSVSGTSVVTGSVGVSGTITQSGVVNTTTQAAVTGQLVWLAPTQTVTAAVSGTITVSSGVSVTIQQGASVSAVVSGTVTVGTGVVSISSMPAVSGTVSITTGTVSISGTIVVSGGGTPITTTQAAATGALVWLAPTQTVSAAVSGTISVSNTITVSGTLTVSSGVSVSAVVSGTVTVSSGVSVTIQQGASVSAVVSGTVSVSGLVYTTTSPVSNPAATGAIVYLGQYDIGRTAVVLIVTTTTFPAASTTVSFTVFVGITTTAGLTSWVVPAGKTFRVNSIQAVVGTSAVATFNTLSVLVSTALPTNAAASPIVAQAYINVNAAVVSGGIIDMAQDIAAGVTVGFGVKSTTSSFLSAAAVVGYLFP